MLLAKVELWTANYFRVLCSIKRVSLGNKIDNLVSTIPTVGRMCQFQSPSIGQVLIHFHFLILNSPQKESNSLTSSQAVDCSK